LILVPVRLALGCILILISYTIIGKLLLIGVDLNYPLTGFRRYYFCRLMRYIIRVLLFILGFVNIKVTGSSDIILKNERQERVTIMVANHLSYLDILVLASVCENIPGFVAKKQILDVPMIGTFSRIWGCIYTDQLANTGVTSKICDRDNQNYHNPLVVFPEGTTTNGKYLIHFHTGAFVPGKPVQPVIIIYPYRHFSPTWETILLSEHLFKLLTQFHNRCHVHFLPIYYPNETEKSDPKLYSQNVRAQMSHISHLPIMESTYPDKLDYHKIVLILK